MSIFKKIKELFEKQNTLYYPGCVTQYVYKDLGDNYRKLLRKSGVDFIELKELTKCCGSPVINAGYAKDYKDLIKHNKEKFEEAGVKKVITNCPACYKILREAYPELEVEHASITLFNAFMKGRLALKKGKDETVTYHDPCHLGRHSGVYEEPRKLLEAAGCMIKEMSSNKNNSLCCGAGAGMQNNTPLTSEKVSKMRLNQAKLLKVKKLVTACPMCYHQLKKHSKGLKVFELSEVLIKNVK